ncbi:MAG: 2-oxoacid:acceptor oxidoreductase subunit alpha [Gemmatimonadota bacterium]
MSEGAVSTDHPGTDGAEAREVRDVVVIRFAGDSGDGMQITGTQFTIATALEGSDLATFPDYPAEIRAPAGTTFGVSAFQVCFGSRDIKTAGDELDVLIAMNPAALKVNLKSLRIGGTILLDAGAFTERNLARAGFETNPLEDEAILAPYQLLALDITRLTLGAVENFELSKKESLRCRNMWALGLMLWMYDRDKSATVDWLARKFAGKGAVADANIAALNAGHAFGETVEMPGHVAGYTVSKATHLAPGAYRTASGTEALAWGLVSGLRSSGLDRLVFGSYPITPASPLLHSLADLRELGVVTFQAEDEIAAVCSAIGASYAGALGVTSSSGPGIALKTEAIALAVSAELPLVVVNSQRAGPSTGMPTKTEQSDLFQALYGRAGDTPVPVIAASTPSDCFEVAREAVRLATKYMTPVMLLTDGYLANAAEPWLIPDVDGLPDFPVPAPPAPGGFEPFARDPQTLARPWAVPGTPGLEHRIGGLEKRSGSGHISYDPENHAEMTSLRLRKIDGIAGDVPEQGVSCGEAGGRLAVVGWGSTFGPIAKAVEWARADGKDVSHVHVRYVWPLPRNLGDLLASYDRILVPEMNAGQFLTLIRSMYVLPARGLSKIEGKPFKIAEISAAIDASLEDSE